MLKFASLFSCAGCVDQLASTNGYEIVYANEYDPEMADLYIRNYGNKHIFIGNILDADIPNGKVDWLHASPPCVLDSGARIKPPTIEQRINQNRVVNRIADFAERMESDFISIENVPAFYKSEAFDALSWRLKLQGYSGEVIALHSQGIGQKRRRGFAFFYKTLSDFPRLPESSTAKKGWGEIIDISKLAPIEYSHLKKQPAVIAELLKVADGRAFIIERGKMGGVPRVRFEDEELWTIVSFLADDGKRGNGRANYLLVVTPDGQGYNMHHNQLKLLQGFAPNFDLGTNPRIAVRAIGNACSPQHLEQAIRAVRSHIDQN